MRLSYNFTLSELTRSQTAARMGIDNTPDEQQVENLQRVCSEILQQCGIQLRKLLSKVYFKTSSQKFLYYREMSGESKAFSLSCSNNCRHSEFIVNLLVVDDHILMKLQIDFKRHTSQLRREWNLVSGKQI